MVEERMKKKSMLSSPFLWCMRCYPITSSSSSSQLTEKPDQEPGVIAETKSTQRKPGGWKTMPYILGNETFERLATIGLLANFMVYLLKQFHMDQVRASNILNIWSGTTNFAPLLGAFICDAYLGRFRTLAFASVAAFLGMVSLTLTTAVPGLHPPPCTKQTHQNDQCVGPTTGQLGILLMALGFLSLGAAGIRPCNLPFGVDQFDSTTDEGRKGINSFFNWSYFTLTVVVMISITLLVYIQDSISWTWGFAIPTAFMFCSIVVFFLGMRVYVYVQPEGSVFSSIAQVFVAAYKKRGLKLPAAEELHGVLYDPPSKVATVSKLPFTQQYRFLNKAAIIVDGEIKPDGSPSNQRRLCSIQQIEEVKCLIRIVPIWASNIICFTSIVQQGTFTVSQALTMDRHLGPKFQIPAGSLGIISMLTLGLWIPFYDRLFVPSLRQITKHEGGITLLQRIGTGMVFSVVSMLVAALVEEKRRAAAISHAPPISVLWLAPQLILTGLCEAFNFIGQIEFYYKQFPEHMQSVAISLFSCTMAGANYFSSVLVVIVHHKTGKHGRPDWLDNNINAGRISYFYFLIAGLGVLNFIYFVICARRYRYKGSVQVGGEEGHVDIELNSTKHFG